MVLKLQSRENSNVLKRVLIYGMPGDGKSTFARNYCKKHDLNPVVLDIDDTNFTGDPIVELNLKSDIQTLNSILTAIDDIKASKFDTIVIDGLGSLLENLVSNSKGQSKYSDRSERFKKIFKKLKNSGCNLIFIGQEDCNMASYTDSVPNKSIILVNSIVNETYYCVRDGKNFVQSIDKFRTELDNEKPVKGNKEEPKPESEKTATEKAIEDHDKRATEKQDKSKEPILEFFKASDYKTVDDDLIVENTIASAKKHLMDTTGEAKTTDIRKFIILHKDELQNIRPGLADDCVKTINEGS